MKMIGLLQVARIVEEKVKIRCSRDQLYAYIIRSNCPDASARVGNRRAFTEDDVDAIVRWFQGNVAPTREPIGV